MKKTALLIVLAALVAATAQAAPLPRPRFQQEAGSYHPQGIPYSSAGTRWQIGANGDTIYATIWFEHVPPNGYGGAGGYAISQAQSILRNNPAYNRVRVTISFMHRFPIGPSVWRRINYTRLFVRS